eukprot:m51a1_g1307 putative cytosolic glycoprotein fp21 (165) ;mRNA; f:208258-209268
MASQVVQLISQDDIKIEVALEVANMSETIKHLIEDLKTDSGLPPVPLPNITGRVLQKVFDFAKHHYTQEKANQKVETEWDLEYLKGEWPALQELLVAANYLDMKVLFDAVVNAIITFFIHGKNPEEIKKAFGFRDFTEEEIQELKKTYTWIDEEIPADPKDEKK